MGRLQIAPLLCAGRCCSEDMNYGAGQLLTVERTATNQSVVFDSLPNLYLIRCTESTPLLFSKSDVRPTLDFVH